MTYLTNIQFKIWIDGMSSSINLKPNFWITKLIMHLFKALKDLLIVLVKEKEKQ